MKVDFLVNNFPHLDLSIFYYLNNEYNQSKVKEKKLALVNINEFKQQFFSTIEEKDLSILMIL